MFNSDQYIDGTIQAKTVYYISDDRIAAGIRHYLVVLNVNPKTSEVIYLACATSKILNTLVLRQDEPVETVVRATPEECDFLTQESAFDCNNLLEKTMSQLIEKRTAGKLEYKGLMPDDIFEKLRKGVLASKLIAPKAKKLIE